MKRGLPLRRRVALAYGLVGVALSLAFGVSTVFIVSDYEVLMLEALLEGHSRDYLEQLAQDPDVELPRTPGFSVYREAEAPPGLRGLPEGRVFELAGKEDLHVAAFGPEGGRVVLVMDIAPVERLEEYLRNLFLTILALGSIASAWLGWLLAGRTVSPVLRLADQVDALPVTPVRTQLEQEYSRDEIGRLAGAIDAYQARLLQADARDRAFFAEASHELRTPIAVIQGAVEVLKDDPGLSAEQRRRLARVERGLLELGGLLEALLLSARGLPAERDRLSLAEQCRLAIKRLDGAGLQAGERLRLAGRGPDGLSAPRRWLDAILDVLFQRVLGFAPGLAWDCVLDEGGLSLRPATGGEAGGPAPLRSDLGVGLAFVERLCAALGWRLEQQAGEQGPSVRLEVRNPA